MSLPNTILVPTDFGEVSEAAIDHAIEYARVLGAEVVLLHSFDLPIISFPDGALVATAELSSKILEGAQGGLTRQVKARQNQGVEVRGIIKQGEPYQMINEAAKEVGAGLIVMGTHGRTGLARALIGSVAEKVVRTATVPVLTVHLAESLKLLKEDVIAAAAAATPTSTKNVAVNGHDAAGVPTHR